MLIWGIEQLKMQVELFVENRFEMLQTYLQFHGLRKTISSLNIAPPPK